MLELLQLEEHFISNQELQVPFHLRVIYINTAIQLQMGLYFICQIAWLFQIRVLHLLKMPVIQAKFIAKLAQQLLHTQHLKIH